MWRNRTTWLASLQATLQTTAGEQARAAAHVAGDTLLLVAAADAATADSSTGRGVATAHDTVAALLGMSSKTVQRARTLIETLGHAVTVFAGRYLTIAERAAARRHHGDAQLRAASTRALTHPRDAVPVEDVQLPRRGNPSPKSHPSENSSTRVTARRKAASITPIPLGVQKLAGQLVVRMPWLARGRHIGALARLLHRHRLDVDAGWSAERLLQQLERHLRTTGASVPDPAEQRNPLGYLHSLLTAAAPALQPSQVQPARAIASWRMEAAARDAQIAAEDPAVRAAVIAQLRAEMARDRLAQSPASRPAAPVRLR